MSLPAESAWRRTLRQVRTPPRAAGETVQAWQSALHAGESLGWKWKIFVFLSGLLPVVFGATGFAMRLYRRRARRRVKRWAS